MQKAALLWGAEGLILLLDLYLCFGLLPVPLRLSNVAEIDVILGSGTARSMPFCPGGVCLPTQIAGRRRPWDQYGVSGVYAAVLAC